MVKTLLAGMMIGVLLLSLSATAEEVKGEFGNECVTSLAFGKKYMTDCSVNTVYQGKTYCFGNEKSREVFLKNPDKVLAEALARYKKPQ
jgi:YHS domain-containing protein